MLDFSKEIKKSKKYERIYKKALKKANLVRIIEKSQKTATSKNAIINY